jgi:hypothetical protein
MLSRYLLHLWLQMIYDYELNGKNNILINYVGTIQELWIDK